MIDQALLFAKKTCSFIELSKCAEKYNGRSGRKGIIMEQKITAKMIGENIRRLRLQYGETQEELGELIGYGATTIANYESGYRMPDLETFFIIAEHYHASLEDFTYREGLAH